MKTGIEDQKEDQELGFESFEEDELTLVSDERIEVLDDQAKRFRWRSIRIFCSRDDLAMDCYFGREEGKILWQLQQIKVIDPDEVGGEITASRAQSEEMDFSLLDMSKWNCGCCGNTRIVKCSRCDSLVCQERSEQREEGLWFVCRDSCGETGWVRGVIEGVKAFDHGGGSQEQAISVGEEG